MSIAERAWRLLGLSAVPLLAAAGCTTLLAFGERMNDDPQTHVIRVADERGITVLDATRRVPFDPGGKGRGTARAPGPDTVRIAIPLEVRAGADSVVLDGCALQKFAAPPDSVALAPGLIHDDPELRLVFPHERVVPAGERRIVTVHLEKAQFDWTRETVGIRIDERAVSLGGGVACDPLGITGDSIQHYRLRLIDAEPIGPGLAAGLLAVLALVIL